MRLNKRLNVITDLDVFGTAGYAIAHDILVPFTVKGDELEANGDTIDFSGVLNVEFLKVSVFLSEFIIYVGIQWDPLIEAHCEFRSPP